MSGRSEHAPPRLFGHEPLAVLSRALASLLAIWMVTFLSPRSIELRYVLCKATPESEPLLRETRLGAQRTHQLTEPPGKRSTGQAVANRRVSAGISGRRDPDPAAVVAVNHPFRNPDATLSHSSTSALIIDNILSIIT